MNDIRARFEEIWPVPECIHWSDGRGMYLALGHEHIHRAVWQNLRLDTFTRCQETTETVNEIILHATNLLNYVRDKYGVIDDNFSCEHMRGIAAAIKELKK